MHSLATAAWRSWVVLLLLLLLLVAAAKEKVANKKDLKYITCDVCEHAVSHAVGQVRQRSRYTTFDEIDRIFAETCDIVKTESWIRKLDIVTHEANRTVGLVSSPEGGISLCGTECLTIRKRCHALVDEDMDRERVVDYVKSKHAKPVSELSVEDVTNKVCRDWSKVCPSKHALAAGESRQDEPFVAMTADAVYKERDEQYQEARAFAEKKGITAIFSVADDMKSVRAKLYWNDKFIGDMKDSLTPQRHQTYMGHTWTVKINGKVVKVWGIGVEPVQWFTLTWADINSPDL